MFLGIGVGINRSRFGGYLQELANAYKARVVADGGVVESLGCFTAFATALGAFKPTLLLDFYQNAAAAYSLRKLSTTYMGDAIRVRRASDNTELNIGFVNNELDTASLTTFCSGTDGFVTTWYDQSGNGNDATQSTASAQPQIVSSGSVILENGKPSVQFDNTDDYLYLSSSINLSNNSYFTVSKMNIGGGSGDYSYIFSSGNNNTFPLQSLAKRHNDGNDANKRYIFNGSASLIDGVNSLSQELASLFFPTSSPYTDLYINNIQQSFSSTATSENEPTNALINIGRYQHGNTHWLDGNLQEFILYNSDQSSNRTGIETNLNNFYSIY